MDSWTFPIVTGSNYRVKWMNNLDFDSMQVSLGQYWASTDLKTYLTFNHTDRRDQIKVTKSNVEIGSFTAATWKTSPNLQFGSQYKPSDSNPQIFTIFAGLKDAADTKTIKMQGIRCLVPSECYEDATGEIDPIP